MREIISFLKIPLRVVCSIGPGLYRIEKKFFYGHNGEELEGKINGTALTTLVGIQYRFPRVQSQWRYRRTLFLNKPADVTVSKNATETTISSGPSTQFLAELSLGLSF